MVLHRATGLLLTRLGDMLPRFARHGLGSVLGRLLDDAKTRLGAASLERAAGDAAPLFLFALLAAATRFRRRRHRAGAARAGLARLLGRRARCFGRFGLAPLGAPGGARRSGGLG